MPKAWRPHDGQTTREGGGRTVSMLGQRVKNSTKIPHTGSGREFRSNTAGLCAGVGWDGVKHVDEVQRVLRVEGGETKGETSGTAYSILEGAMWLLMLGIDRANPLANWADSNVGWRSGLGVRAGAWVRVRVRAMIGKIKKYHGVTKRHEA